MREAQVAHDGGHGGVAGQEPALLEVDGAHGLNHVAVYLVAVGVHQHDAVRVAVVGDTHVRADLGHEVAHGAQMGGAALHVDVGAVEVLVNDRDVRAQAAQRLGARHARGAVAHVERHLEARKVDALVGHGRHGVRDVELAGVVHRQGHAHGVAGRQLLGRGTALRHERLDLVLHRIRQLEALGVEQLDAVVLGRVVRGRDDDAAVAVQLAHEQRDSGCRDDAGQKRCAAHRHDAGRHGRFQHVARKARVLADEDGLALERHGRLAELEGEVARELRVRHPANPVGPEKSCHVTSPFSRVRRGGGRRLAGAPRRSCGC